MEFHSDQYLIQAVADIKQAILCSRYKAAALANREMLSLYYGIGEYISRNSRLNFWGTNAIENISIRLQQELPGLRGFGTANLKYMRLFYEKWCDVLSCHSASDEMEILNCHSTSDEMQVVDYNHFASLPPMKLTAEDWNSFLSIGFTHHREILNKTADVDERLFYIRRCSSEFWSVDKLKYYLAEKLYGKQGIKASNFEATITNPDYKKRAIRMFKDEYILDFVNIEDIDEVDERVIEQEIVLNIKKFIMALGTDFSFIGNQYRLIVDEKEYFIDLLFFNRRLQSLVAIELKRGEFKPEYAGKMNFYLSALDEYVKLPNENPSVGIVLCKSQHKKTVEFAFRDTSKPMGVATFKTSCELPSPYREILPSEEKLKELL